ncbi:hypothetical protein FRB90_002588 [Tulasnella sp. 427]|nr:hypothetical protein FRB90_002588 [Tulasnella sp. 427]
MLLVSSSAAGSLGRLRRFSLTRSKDKKAQDQHFKRTNSGRWVKTEHPLIATDDDDDEARRRRELAAAQTQTEAETQRHDGHDYSNSLPFDVQHDTQQSDLDNEPNQDGSIIPPWHATRPPMHWNPYPTSNPADPVPTTFRPGQAYSNGHPSDPNLASDSPAEDGSSDGAPRGNIHVPPAPIPFPAPSYVIAPKQEERRGRVRRKPGSLYPLHNDIKPPQTYINWHLRPPDLGLPPIFTPANWQPGGGAHGKGTSTPGTDGAGQTVSANGSATGHSGRESRPRTRENSRDGRTYPPSTQPPPLQLATSAILGHAVSQASLRPGPSSAFPVESNNPSPTPSHSDAFLPPHATPGDTMQPHGSATGASTAAPPTDPTKLDLADAWGTDWRYSSPYDLGQGPMTGLHIPVPGSYQPGMSPMRKKDPSPSPLGYRSRKTSREPVDRSGRPSEDRGRASEDNYRPAEYTPSPLSATPDKPVFKVEKKTSTLGRVFDREKDDDDDDKEHRKKGGLKALLSGSATNLQAPQADEGFMPRIRKRTISLGQTGIGIGLPAVSGITAPRTRKQSFEVVRKPSVRPDAPVTPQAEPAKPVVTEAIAVADATVPTAMELLQVETAAGSSRVLPDAEYAHSPTDERERSYSRADDGSYSARPSLDLQRTSSESRNGRNSRELARSPSSQSRFMISGPMPLRKSPSSGSISHGITQLLGHKKSASHLGHGAADGIGLGRNTTVGSVNGAPVTEPPPRGRKLSGIRGPPRTLHRYAPNMEQFDAMYVRPRRDSETSKTSKSSKRESGGVIGKLAKKLSWIAKSKEEKEREQEVEERMKQYERERDLERRLEEARAKATFEDEIRRSRREPSQDAVRDMEPINLDDPQPEDLPMPARPFAESDRGTIDFRRSDIQPALNLFRNLEDDGAVKDGIQFPLASPANKPAPLDPRSPALQMRRGLFQPPGHDGMDSPMPVNQSLTPLGKLASVMMSKPPAAPVEPQATSGSSIFSPLAAAANLLSPKKALSNNNISQSLMSPSPLASALTSDTTPNKRHTRAESSDGHGSSVQGHARRPSRGPSPVPPRPTTPPSRLDSPLSLPRMTLTLMNPDTPSPPTPVQALPPDNWPSRRSISPVNKSIRTPPKSPPRKSTVPDEVLQQRMERMANMPWSDPITSESESEKAKTRPALQHPGLMSPLSQPPFPSPEQTPAVGYGQFGMTPAAGHIPFPSFDEDSAHRSSAMSMATPRASLQHPMSPPESQSQSSSSSSQVMSPEAQSQIMSPPTHSQIMSPSTQSQLMSPQTQSQLMSPSQSQLMSPMSQLMSPPSDPHRSLINYAIAAQAGARSSENLANFSPQTGYILQGGLMTTVAVMMMSPPQREPLEPLPSMQASHNNPVPAPPQMIPSPYTSGQGLEHSEPATSSESEAPPRKEREERIGSSHAMISYEPAPPARPAQPPHSASDPLTPTSKPRPHPRRGDTTIPAMGKQWEIVPDDQSNAGSEGRVSGSKSKRQSSRQHSANVIIEDIRQLDPYEAIKERERQVIDEREFARQKAREDWERQRDAEKQAAREQRRREREAAREREREAAKEAERQRLKELEAEQREQRRLERRSSKLARSSTVSSIPPTPPPKERELRPRESKRQSPTSSSPASPPPQTPSRHRTHHRSNTTESVISQAPAPPPKPAKLTKTSSRRESQRASANSPETTRQQPDQKSPTHSQPTTPADPVETPVRSPKDRHTKAASLLSDRRESIDHVLGKSMPVLPGMADNSFSPSRYQYQEQTRLMSPQSNARSSLASPSMHGSSYTSFSLQSPYMNTPGRPSLGYEPAPPREKSNPIPRPPRDISIDLSL